MIEFELDALSDPVARENFRRLSELIEANPVLGGEFKAYTVVADAVGTYRYKHNLEYIPQDIVITYKSDDGAAVSVKFAETDRTWMSFVVTGRACTFRVLAGRMK